jgi:hypothetical protein
MGMSAIDPAPVFTHRVIRTEGRLLILSTCTLCGEGNLVSAHDGSLAFWEQNHRCCEARSLEVVRSDQGA